MCRILNVSRSGYQNWLDRGQSDREFRDGQLLEKIKAVFEASKKSYGSRRVHKQLILDGEICSRRRVARLMRKNGIRPKMRRRWVQTTNSDHDYSTANNLLNRDFAVGEPNKAWVADITYIPTDEGWLYLAGVVDLYNREAVGWSMSERINRKLVMDALDMAVMNKRPERGLIAHSDRGSQYASFDYQQLLTENGMLCSMSGKGDPWDNAVMESFFGTLKTELIHHKHYKTRNEARRDIFEYIEIFYNRVRLHSALGYLSPLQFAAQTIPKAA